MKKSDIFLNVLVTCLLMIALVSENEAIVMLCYGCVGAVWLCQLTQIISLFMKEPRLFYYLILTVGGVGLGLAGPYVISWIHSLR